MGRRLTQIPFDIETTRFAVDDESSILEHAYEVLVGSGLTDRDPFTDSASAVRAYQEGEFAGLLAHYVADILRTDALAMIAEQYCGKSEFKMKSLTPTVQDKQLQRQEQ